MKHKDCSISLQDFKVLVRCFTYNQSKYIEDTLNGFAMQQTNFPFVCLVMDDASTDGEQDVIKKWMECECDTSNVEFIDFPASVVMIAPHKSNTSCVFAFYMLKHNLYKVEDQKMALVAPWREKCEYEAICEGDDYWIDPLKLQKQVDIMIQDQSIGVCYTRAMVFYQETSSFAKEIGGEKFLGFKSLLLREPIMTLTTMYRTDLYNRYMSEIEPNKRGWLMGDTPMWLWFSMNSQIFFLEDITSVYRVLINSASHSPDYHKQKKFNESLLDIRLFFINNYCPEDKKMKVKVIDDYHKRNMIAALKAYEIKEYYRNCFLLKEPKIKDYLRPIYYVLFKKNIICSI